MSPKTLTAAVTEVTKHALVPKLRFPAFRGALEWKETRLGQLGELVSGLTYGPDDVRATGLLVLRSSNVQNGKIVLDDCVHVDPATKGANLSQVNDILICVRNGSVALIGKNALIPEGMPLCTHGAFMTVFRSKSAKFVFQLFQSDKYQKQVAGDLGATINSINGGQFVKYAFAVPQPVEQQKIADCLSSLDELIAALARKVDALKTHKKWLMQQLFPREGETQPRLRFPEFRDAGEWGKGSLKGLCIRIMDGTHFSPKSKVGPRPYLTSKNIKEGRIDLSNLSYISEVEHADIYSKCPVMTGDVLLTKDGANTRNCAINNLDFEFSLLSSVAVLRGNPIKLHQKFLYQSMLSDSVQSLISESMAGQAITRITLAKIGGFKISVTSLPEQQRIANCLTSLDDLITAATQELETLKTHKKGLMQQLFPAMQEVAP